MVSPPPSSAETNSANLNIIATIAPLTQIDFSSRRYALNPSFFRHNRQWPFQTPPSTNTYIYYNKQMANMLEKIGEGFILYWRQYNVSPMVTNASRGSNGAILRYLLFCWLVRDPQKRPEPPVESIQRVIHSRLRVIHSRQMFEPR